MKRPKIYVYPDRSYSIRPDTNPYINDLVQALSADEVNVIRSKTAWLGVIDIFLYVHRLDAVVFNWVEEVANRTMGYIQAIALLFLIPVLKLLGVKIIWTVHNKASHNPKNRRISAFFRKMLMDQADVRIAHAREDMQSYGSRTVKYHPHPFRRVESIPITPIHFNYDVLIWGSILPYKGVREFLEFVHKYGHNKLRIHVQGKCPDLAYYQALQNLTTDSITLSNKFTSDEELKKLMHSSRTIVFTYRSESVLSSGALIESIANYKTVIGPDFGNFKDCQQAGIVYTFTGFHELIDLIYAIKEERLPLINTENIKDYIRTYSWPAYASFLKQQVITEAGGKQQRMQGQVEKVNQLA